MRRLGSRRSSAKGAAVAEAAGAENSSTNSLDPNRKGDDGGGGGGGVEQVKEFTYRLSCGMCKEKCQEHFIGTTEKELNAALFEHYVDLWEIIQEKPDWDESLPPMVITTGSDHSDFGYSTFGRHLINRHLKHATSRKEVTEWCKANIGVRVKVHKYERRPQDEAFDYKKAKQKAVFVENQEQKEQHWETEKRKMEEAQREKIQQSNALSRDGGCFDEVWNARYEELKQYAEEHDGDTNVPLEFGPNLRLGKWVEMQRKQYRRKHNVRPRLDEGGKVAFSDEKERLLKEIGFQWFSEPKQRWSERGIAVIYGLEGEDGGEC